MGTEEWRAWNQMHTSATQAMSLQAKSCLDAGLEERLVRRAEESGKDIGEMFKALAERLHLTDEQMSFLPFALEDVLPDFTRAPLGTPQLLDGTARTVEDTVRTHTGTDGVIASKREEPTG